MTHFGASDDVGAQLDEVGTRLNQWAERAREQDLETFVAALRRELAAGVTSELAPAYIQAAPPEQMYAGLERYWRKRAEALTRAESGGYAGPDVPDG